MWTLSAAKQQKVQRPEVQLEAAPKAAKAPAGLIADQRPEAQRRKGPGPSKLLYRVTRAWNKLWVRRAVMVVLPLALITAIGWRVAMDPRVQSFVAETRATVITALAERPEFAITGYEVRGASDALAPRIDRAVQLPSGASTLTFDIDAVQARIEGLPPVKSAIVTLGPEGMLQIAVRERRPEALWRDAERRVWQMDREGVALAPAMTRAGYPELPMVLGEGAPDAIDEALRIFHAAPELRSRLRALVRVGARRWDVVLNRGQIIMLPEADPAEALGRVLAWHYGDEVLDRGVIRIDMRVPERPALRLHPRADEILRLRKQLEGEGEET